MAPKVGIDLESYVHLFEGVEKFSSIWDKKHSDHKKPKPVLSSLGPSC